MSGYWIRSKVTEEAPAFEDSWYQWWMKGYHRSWSRREMCFCAPLPSAKEAFPGVPQLQ